MTIAEFNKRWPEKIPASFGGFNSMPDVDAVHDMLLEVRRDIIDFVIPCELNGHSGGDTIFLKLKSKVPLETADIIFRALRPDEFGSAEKRDFDRCNERKPNTLSNWYRLWWD